MEIVLIVTFAGLIGAAVRYLVPGRDRHGLFLLPAVGIMIGSLVFVATVWIVGDPRSVWPWLISLVLTLGGSVGLAWWLPRNRDALDEKLFADLTDTKTAA